ncbi:uncharacterized protein TRAVEDRAFT_23121 [Trametes versicolor FP-101664 SS1]|uniref:uncharacterized protein n=1 Tax=Trametes versicolor (strain FP-101664) TaxID=717944 RepID=UPI0004622279|nr:uncharacterized protein TRAVEDRAFT_23121 [Trametes versicolor FP-101664 SS1]EIW53838.1 hypothetical protein TRAVEDRAFT_23121 [Trametes versicolor FP-101664 SS1]
MDSILLHDPAPRWEDPRNVNHFDSHSARDYIEDIASRSKPRELYCKKLQGLASRCKCDFFCEHTGRLSVFPSTCDSAEALFAEDCTCAEAPVKQNAACLQSICTPQQFSNLVAAEEARCGAGSARSVTEEDELTSDMITSPDWRREPELITDWRRAPAATVWPRDPAATVWPRDLAATAWPREDKATAWRRDLSSESTGVAMVKSDNTFHVGCGSGVTGALASPLVLLPLVIALLATVAAVGPYRRRRASRIELEGPMMHAIDGKKGWSQAA